MDEDTPIWMKAIFDLPPDKQWAFYQALFNLPGITWKFVPPAPINEVR